MSNRRFIALGDLIADYYYNEKKLLGIDGGSSRFNVIANLASMNCKTAIIGGCGNDEVGKTIIKRLDDIGVDVSKIFLKDKATRAYHLMVNQETLPQITYKCSKNSPCDMSSTWYDDSIEDIDYCKKNIYDSDVIILDNLDRFSLAIISGFECDKVLDIGNSKQLLQLKHNQIKSLSNRLEILQLNERVVPDIMKILNVNSMLELYNFFNPKMAMITYGKNGADFIFNDTVYTKTIKECANELDATGAGDAFLSVFVNKYYENSKKIDCNFIDIAFCDAIELTSMVVQNAGARGHIYAKMRANDIKKEKIYDTLQKYHYEKIDKTVER